MMVTEHDWFYDMGETWEHIFGPPDYSFDWKGEHSVVPMSLHQQDFWTAQDDARRKNADGGQARQSSLAALRGRRARAEMASR
jgi:hypothetical protein